MSVKQLAPIWEVASGIWKGRPPQGGTLNWGGRRLSGGIGTDSWKQVQVQQVT